VHGFNGMDGTAAAAALMAINPEVRIIGPSGLDSGSKVFQHFGFAGACRAANL
jgi:hypothetical protein